MFAHLPECLSVHHVCAWHTKVKVELQTDVSHQVDAGNQYGSSPGAASALTVQPSLQLDLVPLFFGSYYVVQAGLELKICLPLPPTLGLMASTAIPAFVLFRKF